MSNKINYVEFPSADLSLTKSFFSAVFGWIFEDYGPGYTAFSATEAGLDGGFYHAPLKSDSDEGAALVVFYSEALELVQERIVKEGGEVVKPIFEFPGGRRFHFIEPSGNEFAVWSDR